MAKVHLKALDFIIVASHYAASGKPKKALAALEMAARHVSLESGEPHAGARIVERGRAGRAEEGYDR